ncbi:MAG: hypothetical protein QOG85_1715 [Gaiellaceae bacterium]|nr:hypothetical protein [Gaiellaceae bacterium]
MLFLVFGSSGAGKTTAVTALRGRVSRLALHDFDEIAVPRGADTAWRHRAYEQWTRRAIEYQADGVDLLLVGQTPLGELLATPSASRLEAVSACLFDCDDATRLARLEARGPEWLERIGGNLEAYFGWAAWMRQHAEDPTSRREVIRIDATLDEMRWSRWDDWQRGDPRWRVHTVDTAALSVEEVAADLVAWIEVERDILRSGTHPLTGLALGA